MWGGWLDVTHKAKAGREGVLNAALGAFPFPLAGEGQGGGKHEALGAS